MTPDRDQPARHSDPFRERFETDVEKLQAQVQRDQQRFRATVVRRDVGEVGVTLLLVALWLILGSWASVEWTWYLTVPVLIWVAGFTLFHRNRHKQPPCESDESLLESAKRSLNDVAAQIWLLKNIFWWYLLPLATSLMIFFGHTSWRLSGNWWGFSVALAGAGLFLFVIYQAIHSLNQRVVRIQLEPRRQTLLNLIAFLEEETPGGDTQELAELVSALSACSDAKHRVDQDSQLSSSTFRRSAIGLAGFLVIMAGVMLFVDLMGHGGNSLVGAVASPKEPDFDDVSAFSQDDVEQIDAWLEQQVELSMYPSLSVAVVRDGEIVYQNALGFEDTNAKRKATPQTPYYVASVTKAFTASIAVILHVRGVIDLDESVVKYLPEDVSLSTTPELGAKITLRQLASHTSGLPRGVPGRVQSVEGRYQLEPQRLYDQLATVELESEPGTEELYSNLGFGLLGHALELAVGKPFDRMVQEMICEPLQLRHTAIQSHQQLRPATGYDGSSWRFERTHSFRARLAASGGLVSSVEDLARFLKAQMEPGLFSGEMRQQLHARSTTADGLRIRTALGWTSRSSVFVGRILEKNGGRSNCSAWIGFSPEHRVGVAVVTNCGGPDVDVLGRWLLVRSVPGAHHPVTKFGYARVAPYTGVRWEDTTPIVRVRDKWYPLVSIDGIPIHRIMEFAHQEYGEKARKRLAEDLVRLLSEMGHQPDWRVALGLETEDGQVKHLQIRMTQHNRNLVWEQRYEAENN